MSKNKLPQLVEQLKAMTTDTITYEGLHNLVVITCGTVSRSAFNDYRTALQAMSVITPLSSCWHPIFKINRQQV